MINKVDVLPNIANDSFTFERVRALYKAYSQTKAADFYVQTLGDEITAVFSLLGCGVNLFALSNADFSELKSFFAFLKVEVFCDIPIAQKLQATVNNTYNVYCLSNEITAKSNEKTIKIADVYKMLQYGTDGDIILPPFDDWYCDFCARYNHLVADYASYKDAIAVCGFANDKYSFITGVATKPCSRNKGQAKLALELLCENLKDKYNNTKILTVITDKNKAFYQKCGFKPLSKVSVCNF